MPVKMNGDASVFSYIYTNEGKPFLRLLIYLPPGGGGGCFYQREEFLLREQILLPPDKLG